MAHKKTPAKQLLIPGNSKLGYGIWHFSIPAVITCVGKSIDCAKLCYATKGFFRYGNVKISLNSRNVARLQPTFVSDIVREIRLKNIRDVRIHVSGDFDDRKYVIKWQQIVKKCPRTSFTFYTRSWRSPELISSILQLSKMPNVVPWFSCDRGTGEPPYHEHIGRAYMAVHDDDYPSYKVDLTFRVLRKSKMTRAKDGSLVCPIERGISVNHEKLSCSTCRLCYESAKIRWLRSNVRPSSNSLPVLN